MVALEIHSSGLACIFDYISLSWSTCAAVAYLWLSSRLGVFSHRSGMI